MIKNTMDVTQFVIDSANVVMNKLSTSGPAAIAVENAWCPFEALTESGLFQAMTTISVYISYFFDYLMVIVVHLMVMVICWTRVLDIAVRITFAPIAMSDIVSEGLHGQGIKYLKKMMVSLLQGAAMFAMLLSYNTIVSQLSGSFSSILASTTLTLAFATMLKQTQGICEDIVGVR